MDDYLIRKKPMHLDCDSDWLVCQLGDIICTISHRKVETCKGKLGLEYKEMNCV